ncbi:MAG: HAMP domain-containing histidine kinase [Rubrivivax sp.]|nr:HAMP domain-containing histidine kinase [Rubrivivax sp.]
MRSLYLRIYLTVVAALALFALVSGWLVQRHLEDQRVRAEGAVRDRVEAWGELLQRSLPPAEASADEQVAAVRDWSLRLRVPMALDDAAGKRLGASDSFMRRMAELPAFGSRLQPIRFDDGRTLWVPRLNPARLNGGARPPPPESRPPWLMPRSWPDGVGLAALLVVLFLAVAGGAFPVVRRLTRRLESLKQGVEAFGAGALNQRVAEDGQDEVAAVGASFNRAATRIEALVRSHQSLLANASHELRSPLARLKMALQMLEDAAPAQRTALRREIDTNIAELDALVEEVLLAGRLDASTTLENRDRVDLLGLLAEEAARVGAEVQGEDLQVQGDERLLRRALRNLLENAQRYGGNEILANVERRGKQVLVRVCDRGPGVPAAYRERIFEAFFRLPGHAERAGGVGLGLSLVRQIAERHGGQVHCEPREGGGSCFVLDLPRL